MQTHTTIGAEHPRRVASPLIQLAAVIARSHHERWDGTGYPDGLAGEAIPLAARICAVCDVFDALLSSRPYKAAWPLEDALAELTAQRGRHFDPALVDAFLALVPALDADLLAAEPEIGVLTVPPAAPPPRSRPAAGSAPAAAAGTSSSRPAAPSPPARG